VGSGCGAGAGEGAGEGCCSGGGALVSGAGAGFGSGLGVVVGFAKILTVVEERSPVFVGALKMWTAPSDDAEEVDAGFEGVVELVVEEDEDVTRGTTLTGTLGVGRVESLSVASASVVEEVDCSEVDVGTGLPPDSTLPHGSLPKTWPVQPQRERQASTQSAAPQKAISDCCCSGCCSEVFESLLRS